MKRLKRLQWLNNFDIKLWYYLLPEVILENPFLKYWLIDSEFHCFSLAHTVLNQPVKLLQSLVPLRNDSSHLQTISTGNNVCGTTSAVSRRFISISARKHCTAPRNWVCTKDTKLFVIKFTSSVFISLITVQFTSPDFVSDSGNIIVHC